MLRLDIDTVVRHVGALWLSPVSSAMEGGHEQPDAAAMLDALARGEMNGAELLRPVSVNFRGERGSK